MHYALLILTSALIQGSRADPIVQSSKDKVTYRGVDTGAVEHFQNIKFAHDTSGPRRFAPPLPFLPPPGSKIDASVAGPACPQTRDAMPPFFAETKEMSEDCLNLRIARPQGTTSRDKLPVVIWLHGGGVVKGSAYDPHFDPDNLITLSQETKTPIIYVALNYRLTIFGFARTPLLKDKKSLNVGIRDQRAGFQWIKDNIADFGGDPDRMTVFGLSAGGTFASMHLMAFGGEQGVPFTQVWSMSGPPGTALNMTSTATEDHTKTVALNVGCDQSQDIEMLSCMRDVPMETLLSAAMKHSVENFPPAGLFTFIPSVDDDMFPDRPSALYKAGRFVKDVPLILGWTQDDGAMNAGPAQLTPDEAAMKKAIKNFAPALEDEDLDTLFSLYAPADFQSRLDQYEASRQKDDPEVPVHWYRLAQILRDLLFTCSSIDFSYEMTKWSSTHLLETAGARVYALNQSMLTPLWRGAGMPYVGVSHGSDTNYIFNGLFPEGEISESDQALSTAMAEAFIRFAATGNPNHAATKTEQHWPRAFPSLGISPASSPESLHVQILGGPLDTGAAIVHPGVSSDAQDGASWVSGMTDYLQQVLPGYGMGAMSDEATRRRSQVIADEKLIERCNFVNSLAEKLGV